MVIVIWSHLLKKELVQEASLRSDMVLQSCCLLPRRSFPFDKDFFFPGTSPLFSFTIRPWSQGLLLRVVLSCFPSQDDLQIYVNQEQIS